MALGPISQATGTAVVIPGNDIDTDRIIPARFLKAVTFDDLAVGLFHDERNTEDGVSKGHPLDAPEHAGAKIIITGENFGCGSSREHAPQAIKRSGFTGVIAGSFAEIFFGNSTTIGLVCAAVGEGARAELSAMVKSDSSTVVTIDVDKLEVRAGGKSYPAQIRPAAREALLSGHWDPLGELLEGLPEVRAVAQRLGHGAK